MYQATKDQAAKEEKEKGKESKRPGSRGSVKSKNSKEEVVPPEASAEEPVAEEQFWPVCRDICHGCINNNFELLE